MIQITHGRLKSIGLAALFLGQFLSFARATESAPDTRPPRIVPHHGGPLTFEQRVSDQWALESVLHMLREWPTANAGERAQLSSLLSDGQVREKVRMALALDQRRPVFQHRTLQGKRTEPYIASSKCPHRQDVRRATTCTYRCCAARVRRLSGVPDPASTLNPGGRRQGARAIAPEPFPLTSSAPDGPVWSRRRPPGQAGVQVSKAIGSCVA